MALYTNAKVGNINIKLILNSKLAGSIITKQLMDQLDHQIDHATTTQIITADGNTKTPIEKIDNFFFKINRIQIPIKVLVMEATQYQALVGNNCTLLSNVEQCQKSRHIAQQCEAMSRKYDTLLSNVSIAQEIIAHYSGITATNTKSIRETFYNELIQNSSLPTNYNFASIITEINKEIEHHTQQRYPITYTSKGKGKLQTPAVILKRIQPPTWKKHRVKSPTNPSYHYTLGNAINIALTGTFTSNATSTLSQQPNIDPMAYVPIAKLDNFTGEEDDTRYQSLINKPQDFNAFKVEFLRYFSNSNNINHLVNIFTTMKQRETEAVTTYLGWFHRNLRQIQAIDANYFTAPQILNQFIHGLHSSILQHVHPLHPGTFQDAVTHTRDFKSAELEANHTQAINLVMNGSSELDSKLEKFSETINQKIKGYLANNNQTIYQSPQ
ncbi:hypothetical protein G9A89_023887 [Geosiphon pyriformis]|nr:hypothetical protein G9A89_023887 [Geosiphon pyriformis]